VQFPLGVFAIAVSTAALPSLSRQASVKDVNGFIETINHSLQMTFFITIPAMVGLIILRKPIVQLFFERGVFDASTTAMTAYALMFYSFGLWAVSGVRVMISAFYALQDTWTPVKIAFVSVTVNITFSLMLMGPLQHGGLALALSIASFIQFSLLMGFLKLKINPWSPMLLSWAVLKFVTASAVMGIGVYTFYAHWLGMGAGSWIGLLFGVLGIILCGMVIYFFMAHVLGCQEPSSVLDVIKGFRFMRPSKDRHG
jgi:putative peptidoglycan lipid II flippase